ncbi:MAG: citrate synthase [Oscillospiraceae bacterium]|nr:citrate synthase [Oscillospiraceae bacterium]
MDDSIKRASEEIITELCTACKPNNYIDTKRYDKRYEVKRGLRNADGTGVLAGLTKIGNVLGYFVQDGERFPAPGQLFYRGVNVVELVNGFVQDDRFGMEETAYLLLFGDLPSREDLSKFTQVLEACRTLPYHFTEDMILSAPSRDVMNKLSRSVLSLYSYDEDDPDDNSYEAQIRKALYLIARCPVIVAHAFAAKKHYFDEESLYLHRPKPGLSMAENFLYSIRPDNHFTKEEARLLDLCMVLHAEHGGGNNSAFACRVLASSGTDIYASISAAVGSLKGHRHGGANKKVMEQFNMLESYVRDWKDEDELREALKRIARKEIGDGTGLIYGIGHAIYTLSDPRAVTLKHFARSVARTKGMEDELALFELVEKIGPGVLNELRGEDRVYCANVDMYSGLVYKMLDIPIDLYTPLFAIARMVGWCAHRIEECCNANKIIRPAYKSVVKTRPFIPLSERG